MPTARTTSDRVDAKALLHVLTQYQRGDFNARMLVDRLALGLGLVLGPLFAHWQIGLDLMWSGIVGGTAAYALHRVREALQ